MPEPKMMSYEEFPVAEGFPEGMMTLPKRDATGMFYHRDVVYAQRDGVPLRLQIIVPKLSRSEVFNLKAEAEDAMPLIVYVQGSAWFKQELYLNLPALCAFAARGYVIALVEYRHSGIAPFPAQVQDCISAVRFMQSHAAEYKADADRTILWGDSSGGHTVAMAGVAGHSDEMNAERGLAPVSIRGVVDYYGPTNIALMNDEPSIQDHRAPESPEGQIIGGVWVPEHRDRADAMDPVRYVSAERELPPFLILHGSKDRLVPFAQSVRFYEALKAAGKEAEFFRAEEADHADPVFFAEEVYDIVDDFMRRAAL